jgi:hypothetical protein
VARSGSGDVPISTASCRGSSGAGEHQR